MMHGLDIKSSDTRRKEYARIYIEIQSYENLLSLSDAFKVGTIFMDLNRPYEEKSKTIE